MTIDSSDIKSVFAGITYTAEEEAKIVRIDSVMGTLVSWHREVYLLVLQVTRTGE